MDEFKKQAKGEIVVGMNGSKATRQSDFAYNSSRGKKSGFSKLRRSRLKQQDKKENG